MTSPLQVESSGPTWILNSHSVHVKEPRPTSRTYRTNSAGKCVSRDQVRRRCLIFGRSPRSENHQPVVEGEATGLSTRSRPIGRHRTTRPWA